MDTITTQADTGLDWTDQVRTVARFISDHELPLFGLEARPTPTSHSDGCHVCIHVAAQDFGVWFPLLERIAEHADMPENLPGSVFCYTVATLAGVRVQVLYIIDAKQAVA